MGNDDKGKPLAFLGHQGLQLVPRLPVESNSVSHCDKMASAVMGDIDLLTGLGVKLSGDTRQTIIAPQGGAYEAASSNRHGAAVQKGDAMFSPWVGQNPPGMVT